MKRKQSRKSARGGWQYVVVFAAAAAALMIGLLYLAITRPIPNRAAQAESAGYVPPFYRAEELPRSLPATLSPASFEQPWVRNAYQVAKEIPQVLAQQPCYCGCERHGHRSLHDCYTDDHAMTCNICLKEALLAGEMTKAGRSAAEIRAAIMRGEWRSVNLRGAM